MRSLKGFMAFGLFLLSFLLLIPAIHAAGSPVYAMPIQAEAADTEAVIFEMDQASNAAADKANRAWPSIMENDAVSSGDSQHALAMANADRGLQEYQAGEAEIVNADETFSEKLAGFLTNPFVVPVLLSIAALGLLLEMFTPGLGVPGLLGLSSLLLFFYGHLVAGLAGYESIILLIIGFALLAAELLVPSGIIGFLGLAAILGSVLLAGGNLKTTAIAILIALIVATAGMVIILKFFGKRLHLFKRIILTDATDTASGYVSAVNRPELVGQIAVTVTALRPSGTIKLNDERIDAVSDGRFVDSGKSVKIIKVEGSRIVVREIDQEGEE
ncbi:NfeD family protein [Planococcus shenhongbingii]|uniref:NfeD family protein n=1 Tax=Planococcus shenhongbingii TaxID=3058398 RepID=A0ABT8ND36_9BACL|nr:NfeD family protein [Planococcus sp. N017]MDN7245801.1 NfeD family protein [Planococcus sp. N017]